MKVYLQEYFLRLRASRKAPEIEANPDDGPDIERCYGDCEEVEE